MLTTIAACDDIWNDTLYRMFTCRSPAIYTPRNAAMVYLPTWYKYTLAFVSYEYGERNRRGQRLRAGASFSPHSPAPNT
jgi:hypothetical protein